MNKKKQTKRMKALILLTLCLMSLSGMAQQQRVHIGDVLCTDNTTVRSCDFDAAGMTAIGVVFYVDSTGQHGWAVKTTEPPTTCQWASSSDDIPGIPNIYSYLEAMRDTNGTLNHQHVMEYQEVHPNYQPHAILEAAQDSGWYLPSLGQLNLLYPYIYEIENTLWILSNQGTQVSWFDKAEYWSSTEFIDIASYTIVPWGQLWDYKTKTSRYGVRAVKNF